MSPAKTIEHNRTEPLTPLQMIQAAIEKGIDPDKLMTFAERYERNRAAEAFGRAITKFQSLCPRITKSRTASIQPRDGSKASFNYKFSGFDDIDKVIRPLLIECGLAISFSTEDVPAKGIKATCRVRHGIHFEDTTLTVPVPAMSNATQGYGAALSYAKRYALCAALNIVITDEDNDGAGLDCLTEAESNSIMKVIELKGADSSRWLKRLLAFAGAESLSRIPRSRYREIMDLLTTPKKEGAK